MGPRCGASGASTGTREAVELRDGDALRYGGKGTSAPVANVNDEIAKGDRRYAGDRPGQHRQGMLQLDGSPNRG